MDDDYSDKINIDDLFQRKREVDQLKLKVFRKILNRVHNKIKITYLIFINPCVNIEISCVH